MSRPNFNGEADDVFKSLQAKINCWSIRKQRNSGKNIDDDWLILTCLHSLPSDVMHANLAFASHLPKSLFQWRQWRHKCLVKFESDFTPLDCIRSVYDSRSNLKHRPVPHLAFNHSAIASTIYIYVYMCVCVCVCQQCSNDWRMHICINSPSIHLAVLTKRQLYLLYSHDLTPFIHLGTLFWMNCV